MLVPMRYRFTDFVLDDDRFELGRGHEPVELRKKVFDLLVVLVRARERVVSREELVERLWDSTTVGAGSLSGLVNELRAALGESGRGPSVIRTVHARGYQFVAPVAIEDGAEPSDERSASVAGSGSATRLRPAAEASRALSASVLRVEALGQARSTVERGGAQAWVCTSPDPARRAEWLAAHADAAERAGFRVEHAGPTAGTGSDGGDTQREGSEESGPDAGTAPDASVDGSPGDAPNRPKGRAPIALCFEVDDPEAWQAAGGLARLLDLLGRAPVLVLAAIAPAEDAGPIPRCVEVDPRIVRVSSLGEAGSSRIDLDDWSTPARPAAPFAEVLQALARIDAPGFAAALRTLGFVAARPEQEAPVRVLRRVTPERAAIGTREVEAS